MNSHCEELLKDIRHTLLRMSNLTITALQCSIQALIDRNDLLAEEVISGDRTIDELEMEVDDKVVRYMATHAPMARDLRLMLMTSKISSHLERIADQATTIARSVKALNQEPYQLVPKPIPEMAEQSGSMLRDALSSFIDGAYETAYQVIACDQEVDQLNRAAISELVERMAKEPASIRGAVYLMSISKAIERSADHAQNIAEEVYYLYQGRDIRHRRETGVIDEKLQ